MVTVKFYLDSKADKIKLYPIHLVIRQKELQVKVSTGEKLKKKDWDHKNQIVKESEYRHKSMNKFLSFIKLEVEKVIESNRVDEFFDEFYPQVKEIYNHQLSKGQANILLNKINLF